MKKNFSASKSDLRKMVAFVKEQAAAQGFVGETLSRLELIAEEGLINIISYAYPDGQGSIEISCDVPDKPGLQITIIDYGTPFDPVANAKKVDIKAPLEERTYGGYGIFFIHKIMDRVDYRREKNANILTLTKYKNLTL